jgi:hypothetical protein
MRLYEDGEATFYISKTDTAHGTTDSMIPSKGAEADAVIVTALRGDSPKLGPSEIAKEQNHAA